MAVKQLSAIYLAGVAGFGVAIAFAHAPGLKATGGQTASYLDDRLHAYVIDPAANLMHREVAAFRSGGEPRVEIALQPVRRKASLPPTPALRPSLIPSQPVFAENHAPAAPANSDAAAPAETSRRTIALPQLPKLADGLAKLHLAPQPSMPEATGDVPSGDLPSPSYDELARVTHHLHESLTREMLARFELFLYVSKANAGPWAQHMYVFAKQPDGDLKLLHNWAVSTGREKVEYDPAGAREPSFTPQGYFELDPKRMYVNHVSGQWHTPMPHSMFFNWINRGYETGLAIHAATGEDIDQLGRRASAGCVRLSPQDAAILFDLVRSKYKGLVPKLAYDRRTQTTSNDGMLVHDSHGRVQLIEGYKALVFIEDFGGQNVVAALY